MDLIDKITAQLPLGKKTASPEYFFALNIGLSQVTASVWEMLDGRLEILSQKTSDYSGTDEFVEKTYQTLDQSLGALEIDPQKILFGVPDAWSQDEDLKEPYLKLLRKLLKEADLQPLAYVLTTNAMAFYLQKQEGTPPTAILLGIGDSLEATLVQGGKVIENRSTAHRGELFDDVEKVLGEFHDSEVLPSKILLYGSRAKENLAKVRDQLMSFPWMQKLSFLHFPKIEVLDNDICTRAIIAAAASEINPEVDLKHSFTSAVHETSRVDEDDLGFVKGDIKESRQTEEIEPEEMEMLEDDNLVSPDPDLIGADLPEEENFQPARGVFKEANRLPALWGQVTEAVAPLATKFHLPKGMDSQGTKIKLILGVLVIVVLTGIYLTFAKATVTVLVEPRNLEKDAQVMADPSAKVVDEAKNIIPGSVVQTSVSGSGKGTTSGKKQIGDPAKGQVTIYNMTHDQVTLSQGTTLTSNSGLKFTLDRSTSVASQSATTTPDGILTKWGKSDPAGVTASVIGPDSNMSVSSQNDTSTYLSVGGYAKSQVWALVTTALSGGTSKNVTVVAADDQKKLKAQVLDDLKQKAAADLQGKMTEGKKIIADALQAVDGKYTFSKDVGDQASEFTLNATINFKGVAYSDSDLRTIVGKLVATDVPAGYTLDLSTAQTQADVVSIDKSGKLIFGAKFKASLMPKFNEDDLRKQIAGKSVTDVVNQLRSLDNVVGSEINLSPKLPGPLARLPFLSQNISIIVTPK